MIVIIVKTNPWFPLCPLFPLFGIRPQQPGLLGSLDDDDEEDEDGGDDEEGHDYHDDEEEEPTILCSGAWHRLTPGTKINLCKKS